MSDNGTTTNIEENYKDEIAFFEKLGINNKEEVINGLIENNGIGPYLEKLYPEIKFCDFVSNVLRNYYDSQLRAFEVLINVKGDKVLAIEQLNPEMYEVYKEIKEKENSKTPDEILEAMLFNQWSFYNNAERAIAFLNRAVVYSKENETIKSEYGLNNDDLNLRTLFKTEGNVIDAVLEIDKSVVLNQIIEKLKENKISYDEQDIESRITYTKTYEKTAAYYQLQALGPKLISIIDLIFYFMNDEEKLNIVTKNNNNPYMAGIDYNQWSDLYEQFKGQYSTMIFYFIAKGTETDLSKIKENGEAGDKVCNEIREIEPNYMFDDDTLERIYRYNLKPENIFSSNSELLRKYAVNKLKSLGYEDSDIEKSYEFLDFKDIIDHQAILISFIKEGKLSILKELREVIGEFNFSYAFNLLSKCFKENNYDFWGTLYDFNGYPTDLKAAKPIKEIYEICTQFQLKIKNPGVADFSLLKKHEFDFDKAVEEADKIYLESS